MKSCIYLYTTKND